MKTEFVDEMSHVDKVQRLLFFERVKVANIVSDHYFNEERISKIAELAKQNDAEVIATNDFNIIIRTDNWFSPWLTEMSEYSTWACYYEPRMGELTKAIQLNTPFGREELIQEITHLLSLTFLDYGKYFFGTGYQDTDSLIEKWKALGFSEDQIFECEKKAASYGSLLQNPNYKTRLAPRHSDNTEFTIVYEEKYTSVFCPKCGSEKRMNCKTPSSFTCACGHEIKFI